MNNEQQKQLDEQGYVILPQLLIPNQIEALRNRLEELWAVEGENAGAENYIEPGVRRLANLANKGHLFRGIYAHPQVVEIIGAIVGPEIHVSMVNARDVPPNTGVRMPFHMDTDGGRMRDEKGFNAATAIWMLDPFTVANGATAFVPGSHLLGKKPKQVLSDLNASHPDEIMVEGKAGDVLVFNGHCWHAGRPNQTDNHRRALLIHYLRADIPRADNRRQHLDPGILAELTTREREVLRVDDLNGR